MMQEQCEGVVRGDAEVAAHSVAGKCPDALALVKHQARPLRGSDPDHVIGSEAAPRAQGGKVKVEPREIVRPGELKLELLVELAT